MSMTDPVADLLTRVRNASKARKPVVDVPASNLKREIVRILKDNLYVRDFIELPDNKQGILRIYMKYSENETCAIFGLKRMSKVSKRSYIKSRDIKPVLNGMGISVLTTSKGVLTDRQARQENVGGELLCTIW